MQTKNALANLKNRYKAVLEKCHLLNKFGSLALVGLIAVGASAALELAQPNIAFANAIGREDNSTDGTMTSVNNEELIVNTDLTIGSSDSAIAGYAVTNNTANTGNNESAEANMNKLTIGNSGVVDDAYSGYAVNRNTSPSGVNTGAATASGNSLIVDGEVLDRAYGGRAWSISYYSNYNNKTGDTGAVIANKNSVVINSSLSPSEVYGGSAESIVFQYNQITFDGGNAGSAIANENTVTINSGTGSNVLVYGGYAESIGGIGGEIKFGADIDEATAGNGGNADGATANYNLVTISSSANYTAIYAGYALSNGGLAQSDDGIPSNKGGDAGFSIANNNTITITTVASASNIYGGYAESRGGDNNNSRHHESSGGNASYATANENTVNIKSSAIATNVYGAYAKSEKGLAPNDGIEDIATANYNKIIIDSATISGNIIAGIADGNNESRAENNSVNISGNATLANAKIWGGAISTTPSTNVNTFNGNMLNIANYSNSNTIASIGNFEGYSFILDSEVTNGNTILQVDDLYLGNGIGPAATTFASIASVSLESEHSLKIGDEIILIDATNIDGTIANDGGTVISDATTFTQQNWEVNQDDTNTQITATFLSETAKKAETESLTLSQSRAGSTVVKASSLLIADEAMASAKSASSNKNLTTDDNNTIGQLSAEQGINAGSSSYTKSTWSPFALLQGGYNSFDSGAETDVTSISFMAGLARTSYFDKGELMLGAFFETGTGSYDTKSNIGGTRIDSDGNLNYYGAGILGRYDFYTENGTPYLEASARLGSINSDYDTNDIIDVTTGAGVNYETNAMYYGLHLGAGHIFQIAEQWKLDLSAKYFWTHNESVEEEIGGNRFDFDSINSHVARLGAKVTYDAIQSGTYSFSPYAGLAYEYEFDSNASARVDNIAIPADSDLQGSTAVLELGAQYKHINGLTLSASIEGSLGKREGVNGKLEFIYEF